MRQALLRAAPFNSAAETQRGLNQFDKPTRVVRSIMNAEGIDVLRPIAVCSRRRLLLGNNRGNHGIKRANAADERDAVAVESRGMEYEEVSALA